MDVSDLGCRSHEKRQVELKTIRNSHVQVPEGSRVNAKCKGPEAGLRVEVQGHRAKTWSISNQVGN